MGYMGVIIYIYAIVGFAMFAKSDPFHFGSLPRYYYYEDYYYNEDYSQQRQQWRQQTSGGGHEEEEEGDLFVVIIDCKSERHHW